MGILAAIAKALAPKKTPLPRDGCRRKRRSLCIRQRIGLRRHDRLFSSNIEGPACAGRSIGRSIFRSREAVGVAGYVVFSIGLNLFALHLLTQRKK
jgi:hypothetical protein